MTTTHAPEIHGSATEYRDSRYRLYTVEHLPFDALPSYRDGGPSTVVVNGWSTSTSSLCGVFSSPSVVAADDRKFTVSAHRVGDYSNPGAQYAPKHPLDGQKFGTQTDADRALYEAGLTAKMVYLRDAHKWEATAPDA